jgi:hypothetical protein
VNTQVTSAAKAAAKGGLVSTFLEIGRSEGIRGYWRGNIPQVRRGRAPRRCASTLTHTRAAVPRQCTTTWRNHAARPHGWRLTRRCVCLRLPQVLRVLPYSACQLYRRALARCAPACVRVSDGGGRRSVSLSTTNGALTRMPLFHASLPTRAQL